MSATEGFLNTSNLKKDFVEKIFLLKKVLPRTLKSKKESRLHIIALAIPLSTLAQISVLARFNYSEFKMLF